jgi:threonine/homoserine/homoserine lactone efflux protein
VARVLQQGVAVLTVELVLALMVFAVVSSATPGPNTLMLLASGLNHGFRRTVPHIVGVGVGFPVMVLAIGLGLGEVFERVPGSLAALRVVGAGYLLYLAWRIARAGPLEVETGEARPFSFWQAAAFQWVNVKAWVMAITAITVYVVPVDVHRSVLVIALVFALVSFPVSSAWTLFGSVLRRWLTSERSVRRFNVTMALLLVLTLYPMLFGRMA